MGTPEFNAFGAKASGDDNQDGLAIVRKKTPPNRTPLAGGAAQAKALPITGTNQIEALPGRPDGTAGITVPRGILVGLKTPPRAINQNSAARLATLSGTATAGSEATRPKQPRKNGISYDIQAPNPEYGFLVPEERKPSTISRASVVRRNFKTPPPISYLYRNGTSNPVEDSWELMTKKPVLSATELRSMARNVLVDSSVLAGSKPKHQVFLDARLAVLTDSKSCRQESEPVGTA